MGQFERGKSKSQKQKWDKKVGQFDRGKSKSQKQKWDKKVAQFWLEISPVDFVDVIRGDLTN